MSDRMTPIPFARLVEWVLQEYKKTKTVFGVYRPYVAKPANSRALFGRKLETPVGPAAGPHTQLAQNLAAAYYSGSRFFELKTVQILDGEDLPVNKPCIKAEDEGYNCEWSTELYVPQAQEEYIKAWFLLKMMAKEFGLGEMDGFQFNMSVGYDLEGIRSEKVNTFVDSMMDASHTEEFRACKQYLLEHIGEFERFTREDVEAISPKICNSVTLSTLHGCPPQEIERIAVYLMKEKGLNTFIKCNPTLLGYAFARKTMDEMGYDYISFGDFHFKDDLQYEDAVPMLKRLMALGREKELAFGVKITNTCPVDVKEKELPSEEMYLSGKALYPLSVALAAKLSEDFDGNLRISYSGGADAFHVRNLVETGIFPVTVATTLLKSGGYQRMEQLALETETAKISASGTIDTKSLRALADAAATDPYLVKAVKPLPLRKMKKQVPLTDCFTAPCEAGCPIHQDIPAYLKLVGEGKMEEALRVITEKNPLPFITGTICAHNCMGTCARRFYEMPVHIRNGKLLAAEGGFDGLMRELSNQTANGGKADALKKAAVVGGGPAGMAAAFFLTRAGVNVTLYEQKDSLGGVVKHVIPDFRISDRAIENDVRLVTAYGAEVKLNTRIERLDELKAAYDAVILATGASEAGTLKLKRGETVNALEFLADFKKRGGKLDIGKHVVVIGGGNTAMDTARAAKRTEGVEHVSLVYRRTKRYMPADAEELELAVKDGVEFLELLAPDYLENGTLVCEEMRLDEPDASGRRSVKPTGKQVEVPADTVIAAVGEHVPTGFYEKNGLNVSERGMALVNEETLESSVKGVYVIGDGLGGPATVVEGIRDAKRAAEAIAGHAVSKDVSFHAEEADIYARRGALVLQQDGRAETGRCLSCSSICESCAEVCPNRANVVIRIPDAKKHQILHVDTMCNECGNCMSFCPYDSAPYRDKFTLFANEDDMENSKNQGFTVLNRETATCRVRYLGNTVTWKTGDQTDLPELLCKMMETVCRDYGYLI